MKVLIVSAVYDPEAIVSAQTSKQIANALADQGHEVEVITNFPNRPAGKLYAGYSRRLYKREMTEKGIKILRCYTTLSPTSTLLSRLLENLTFGITSGLAMLTIHGMDVIYANTWPIFASLCLIVIAKLKHIPVVMSIQDVYPESLLSQGRLKPTSVLVQLMRYIDKFIAQSAERLIVISQQFATVYCDDRRQSKNKVRIIHNWVDSKSITPNVDEKNRIRFQHGIPDAAFLFVYGGNIGVAAAVENVIDAFKYWKGTPEAYLLIAGSGSNLESCQELVEKLQLSNVRFHSPWNSQETSAVLAAADVLILPTRGEQSIVSVPSKLISYMLAERAVIAQAMPDSELADVIKTAGAGWVVLPEHPAQFSMMLQKLAQMPADTLRQYGRAGRAYALQYFVTESCLPQVIDLIEQVVEAARGG